MKKCRRCGETKGFNEFYKHRNIPDGYLNFCKACKRANSTKYYADNLEKCRAYNRFQYQKQKIRNGGIHDRQT